MLDSDLKRKQSYLDYRFGGEKQKATLAYSLLAVGIVLFLLTLSGLFNGISNSVEYFLTDTLGYTNKWSKTFGPQPFVNLMDDISALSSKFFITISIILITLYYRIREEHKQVWKFLFVIVGGISFLIFVKLLFAKDTPEDPILLIITNIGSYPSGHAFIAVIFYLTLAVILSRTQKSSGVRRMLFIAASVIIFLVGISRIFGASHNLNEVIAGWSLGLVWVSICWLIERFIKINYKLKLE